MTERQGIRMFNAAIDEAEDGEIVFRGIIDPSYLHMLRVDPAAQGGYQREELVQSDIAVMAQDLLSGDKFPDMVLGMRGTKYEDEDAATWLLDPVFIIDGQQRRAAGLMAMQSALTSSNPTFMPRLGATVIIGTTRQSEADRFVKLNTKYKRVVPSVLLQIGRTRSPALDTLFLLTRDRSFALCDHVCWDQRRHHSHLMSGLAYVKVMITLYRHLGTGFSASGQGTDAFASALDRIGRAVGLSRLRDNTRTFFEVVDQAWGCRDLNRKSNVSWMRLNFLYALAEMFSRNVDFWDGDDLVVDRDDMVKLSKFRTDEPNVIALASGGSQAQRALTLLLEDHLDHGRRSGRLKRRAGGDRRRAPEQAKTETVT